MGHECGPFGVLAAIPPSKFPKIFRLRQQEFFVAVIIGDLKMAAIPALALPVRPPPTESSTMAHQR